MKNPTRSRILSATLSLLENNGAAAVRMSDIAKAAGVSRQALYLHFPNRAELLIATVRYVDELNDIEKRLAPSRALTDGRKRLDAWVLAWGEYIPHVFGVAQALLAMRSTDPEAQAAWDDRMQAVRHGCQSVVDALHAQNQLMPELSRDEATDLLAGILSIQTWEHLRLTSGWTQKRYIEVIQQTAARAIVFSKT